MTVAVLTDGVLFICSSRTIEATNAVDLVLTVLPGSNPLLQLL